MGQRDRDKGWYLFLIVIKKEDKLLTRKEFLKTSVWMLTCSFIGSKTFDKLDYESPNKIILGRTGIKVPAICYGASRTQEIALIKTVLDKEINFFDTGRSYANGQNEIMLGKALKGLRKQVVIQSKIKPRISVKFCVFVWIIICSSLIL